jgi:hypothetical protein
MGKCTALRTCVVFGNSSNREQPSEHRDTVLGGTVSTRVGNTSGHDHEAAVIRRKYGQTRRSGLPEMKCQAADPIMIKGFEQLGRL